MSYRPPCQEQSCSGLMFILNTDEVTVQDTEACYQCPVCGAQVHAKDLI